MHTYVLYHANCLDGMASKYVAWLHFGDNPNVTYIPVAYDEPFPDIPLTKNTQIFVLDFSYPRSQLLYVEQMVFRLVVLDHHKTAQEELAWLSFATFDSNKSGCGLAWDYFLQTNLCQ